MDDMCGMHYRTSHMHLANLAGIVEQALGFAGRLSAEVLIVLTSAPVLKVLAALVFLLALAAVLRLLLARRASHS